VRGEEECATTDGGGRRRADRDVFTTCSVEKPAPTADAKYTFGYDKLEN
jgi:hypothetical protein